MKDSQIPINIRYVLGVLHTFARVKEILDSNLEKVVDSFTLPDQFTTGKAFEKVSFQDAARFTIDYLEKNPKYKERISKNLNLELINKGYKLYLNQITA